MGQGKASCARFHGATPLAPLVFTVTALLALLPAAMAVAYNLNPTPPDPVVCPGILLDYVINVFTAVPYPTGTAYSFNATLVVQNVGTSTATNWGVAIGYKNNERITAVTGLNTTTLPVAGADTLFTPPKGKMILKDAFDAAGVEDQYSLTATFMGVENGATTVAAAVPAYLRFVSTGYSCDTNATSGAVKAIGLNRVRSCCAEGTTPSVSTAPVAVDTTGFPLASSCQGVLIDYLITSLGNGTDLSPAPFTAKMLLQDTGSIPLENFGVYIGYANGETLTKVDSLDTPVGVTLPAPGNGTELKSPPGTFLNSSANGGVFQLLVNIDGTIGVTLANQSEALPTSLTLVATGYNCAPSNFSLVPGALDARQCCTQMYTAANIVCPGVQVDYTVVNLTKVPDPSNKAYRFNADITLANQGSRVLAGWSLKFGFQNNETITAVQNLVVPAGTSLPLPGQGLVLGSPPTAASIPPATLVAGDTTKYTVSATLTGTEYGATTLLAARPSYITVVNSGLSCSPDNYTTPISSPNTGRQCCVEVVAEAPSAATGACVGVLISYTVDSLTPIPDPSGKAFAFKSTVIVEDVGSRNLPTYQLRFGFVNSEIITATDFDLQAQFLPRAGNDTSFASPAYQPFLITPYQAAGNISLYQATATISGTERGAETEADALPGAIYLDVANYRCDPANFSRPSPLSPTVTQCCMETPLPPAPAPAPAVVVPDLAPGIFVQWDVIFQNETQYTVRVQVKNLDPFATINGGWAVGWLWENDEYILSVEGGTVVNFGNCLESVAYNDFPNFATKVQGGSCAPDPQLIDTTDHEGVLTGYEVDLGNSTANFTVHVGKPKRQWTSATIIPPANFTVGLAGWACNPPTLVNGRQVPFSPTSKQFVSSYASYNITCGPLDPSATLPKCCVSFSSFFNNTLARCKSCACGGCVGKGFAATAPASAPSPASASAPAPAALALPQAAVEKVTCDFNTSSTQGWASTFDLGVDQSKYSVPHSKPAVGLQQCDDNCPLELHYDIVKAYQGGWQVQVALANRNPSNIAGWMVAMAMPQLPYLQTVYSVDFKTDTSNGRDFIMFQGYKGYNDLLLGPTATGPGNQVWIMLFNQTGNQTTPTAVVQNRIPALTAITELAFPTQVWIDGYKCEMPDPSTIPCVLCAGADRLVMSTLVVGLVLLPLLTAFGVL